MTAHYRWFCILATACLALAPAARGQRTSPWRVFNTRNGLPESACETVALSPQGNVLVRFSHNSGMAELDGFNTVTSPVPPGMIGPIESSPSGQNWAVVKPGLAELRKGEWQIHPVPEIAAALGRLSPVSSASGLPFLPVRQNRVLFLLPERLMVWEIDNAEVHVDELRRAEQLGLGSFTGLAPARDGGLWVSGDRGVAKLPGPARNLTPAEPWREFPLPQDIVVNGLRRPREDDQGVVSFTADSADHRGTVLVRFDGSSQWETQFLAIPRVLQAWRGPNHTTWAITPVTPSLKRALTWPRESMLKETSVGAGTVTSLSAAMAVASLIWISPMGLPGA